MANMVIKVILIPFIAGGTWGKRQISCRLKYASRSKKNISKGKIQQKFKSIWTLTCPLLVTYNLRN